MSTTETTAHHAQILLNSTLDAEMDAARADGTLINAWRLSDGCEVLATRGKLAVALTDGRILRGDCPDGVNTRIAVQCIMAAEGAEIDGMAEDTKREPRPSSYYDGPPNVSLGGCSNCARPLTEHTGGNLACPGSLR